MGFLEDRAMDVEYVAGYKAESFMRPGSELSNAVKVAADLGYDLSVDGICMLRFENGSDDDVEAFIEALLNRIVDDIRREVWQSSIAILLITVRGRTVAWSRIGPFRLAECPLGCRFASIIVVGSPSIRCRLVIALE